MELTGGRPLIKESVSLRIKGKTLGDYFPVTTGMSDPNIVKNEVIRVSVMDLFFILWDGIISGNKEDELKSEVMKFSSSQNEIGFIKKYGDCIIKSIILNELVGAKLKLNDYADIVELACILE